MVKLPPTSRGQDFTTHDQIYTKKENQTAKDTMLSKAQSENVPLSKQYVKYLQIPVIKKVKL